MYSLNLKTARIILPSLNLNRHDAYDPWPVFNLRIDETTVGNNYSRTKHDINIINWHNFDNKLRTEWLGNETRSLTSYQNLGWGRVGSNVVAAKLTEAILISKFEKWYFFFREVADRTSLTDSIRFDSELKISMTVTPPSQLRL